MDKDIQPMQQSCGKATNVHACCMYAWNKIGVAALVWMGSLPTDMVCSGCKLLLCDVLTKAEADFFLSVIAWTAALHGLHTDVTCIPVTGSILHARSSCLQWLRQLAAIVGPCTCRPRFCQYTYSRASSRGAASGDYNPSVSGTSKALSACQASCMHIHT